MKRGEKWTKCRSAITENEKQDGKFKPNHTKITFKNMCNKYVNKIPPQKNDIDSFKIKWSKKTLCAKHIHNKKLAG